jgi:dihydroneopterin aldolase/2-amino-4-hydroxy-6-hydroxymethyldihydropteridine diphosphokinase
MDKIKIENLEIFANHGVLPEENKLGQKFLINAVLYLDMREAGKSDDLEKTVDYGKISRLITDLMKKNTCQLIESAAEQIAEALLLETEHLSRVLLEIKKPWAPIGLPLESVSVEIERGWHSVYLSFGSNMGNREEHIQKALKSLGEIPECRVNRISEIIETKPYGGVEQGDFLNGCLQLDTMLTPLELLEKLHRIEREAGRERKVRWGPRTLDLDILFYDRELIETESLVIPHIDLEHRYFVLKPLAEIAPNLRHPISKKTVSQMLRAVQGPETEKGEII